MNCKTYNAVAGEGCPRETPTSPEKFKEGIGANLGKKTLPAEGSGDLFPPHEPPQDPLGCSLETLEADLQGNFFTVLSVLQRGSFVYMRRQAADMELVFPPPYIFCIEEREGLSQDELAQAMHMDKGAIARSVKIMEDRGFIRRQQDPEDRRKKGLFLTDKGRGILAKMRACEQQFIDTVTAGMSPEEKDALFQLTRRGAVNLLNQLAQEDNLKKTKVNGLRNTRKEE